MSFRTWKALLLMLFVNCSARAQTNATFTIEYSKIAEASKEDYQDFLLTESRIFQSYLMAGKVADALGKQRGHVSIKADVVEPTPSIRLAIVASDAEAVAREYLRQYVKFRYQEATNDVVRVSFVPEKFAKTTNDLQRLNDGSTSLYARVQTTNLAFTARIARALLNGRAIRLFGAENTPPNQ